MTQHLHTQADLDRALGELTLRDPRLAPLLALTGMPALRRREPGFAGLASTICGQQLSTHAAAAIWARLSAAVTPLDAERIRRARTDRLGRLGLSAAKIRTLKAIAGEVMKGHLDLDELAGAPADEAHARLIALHGIGPWTADIYLLFCLGHGDAWPAGDLAVQEAIRIAFVLPTRPGTKETIALGDAWRPWRGAAAHLFWAYYKLAKAPGFAAAPALAPVEAGTEPATKPARNPNADRRSRPEAKPAASERLKRAKP
ncbi:DNA-3-methyladenine glycosylase [Bradyrhizobium sp. WD16]|uniref:DNA-3-methyladenine glycosylase family protein n=1 Tax=Bradyrhizobium sp. WD16 TaxID=1521768 RepID=UPI0020A5C208|nr:DNA-3-methyladenine glycosylase 2 family protein [Bradyrhizobium sp. WD16]UTD27581.1 DNA-3-methyladenine glycosidase [Bradyrhizobium sp. WD16]